MPANFVICHFVHLSCIQTSHLQNFIVQYTFNHHLWMSYLQAGAHFKTHEKLVWSSVYGISCIDANHALIKGSEIILNFQHRTALLSSRRTARARLYFIKPLLFMVAQHPARKNSSRFSHFLSTDNLYPSKQWIISTHSTGKDKNTSMM